MGVTLGSPAGDLRTALGDPLIVEHTSDLSRTADYLRPDDISGILRVTERGGQVFAVEIERERPEPLPGPADSHGVRVGMSRADVTAKRGQPAFETANTELYPEDPEEDASTIYRFDGDIVESIKLVGSGTSVPGDPALPPLTETAGDAYGTAILDLTPTVLGSDHFRERYLVLHGCDAAGRRSTVDHRDGKTYAIVSATCNDRKRVIFFDISRARP
jgi:hypothetical protein